MFGEVCKQNHQQPATHDIHVTVTIVLALATLGGVTKNRNDPFRVALLKVAKASTIASVACRCHWHYHTKPLPGERDSCLGQVFKFKLGCLAQQKNEYTT